MGEFLNEINTQCHNKKCGKTYAHEKTFCSVKKLDWQDLSVIRKKKLDTSGTARIKNS